MGTIIVWLFVEFFTFQFFLQRNKKLENLLKLKISEWSVVMVRMGNSGPLNARLANQIKVLFYYFL